MPTVHPAGRSTGRVIEQMTVARHPQEPNGDTLVVGPHVVGVVDGSTAKGWESGTTTGIDVAATVAWLLSGLADEHLTTAAHRLAREVLHLPGIADTDPVDRPCATFSLVHLQRREVWRVGDQHVLVGPRAVPTLSRAEHDVARRRAELIRGMLAAGRSREALQQHDAAREQIQELLHGLNRRRNVDQDGGFGAVDGSDVPRRFLEVHPIPVEVEEVVLATDGYPEVFADLARTEANLQARLERDPLLIEDPPATKGRMHGAVSFDDRAYVRVRVGAW